MIYILISFYFFHYSYDGRCGGLGEPRSRGTSPCAQILPPLLPPEAQYRRHTHTPVSGHNYIRNFDKDICDKMGDSKGSRGQTPNFSPSLNIRKLLLSNNLMKKNIIYFIFCFASAHLTVHLPNQGFCTMSYDDTTDVRQIIDIVLDQVSQGQPINRQFYSLRLKHMLTKEVIN